jgi:hypothetical protein
MGTIGRRLQNNQNHMSAEQLRAAHEKLNQAQSILAKMIQERATRVMGMTGVEMSKKQQLG